jgi:cytochrome P450/NADPH-cytochrome P450 reductase
LRPTCRQRWTNLKYGGTRHGGASRVGSHSQASGSLLDLQGDTPLLNLLELAKIYGPIFRLEIAGRNMIVVSSFELVNEVCDDHRFDKMLGPGLLQARVIVGDGLFTAWTHEANWKKAHNILTPSFGSMAIRSYLPEMSDIATQLVEKWARLNPDEDIDVAADMTRSTLDTIGICAFSYRFILQQRGIRSYSP